MSSKIHFQELTSAPAIKLLSTDFDGTLFAEFENPPVPHALQKIIGDLQAQGTKWVINTGRELTSLMEILGRARLAVKPDYLILVEREIYVHEDSKYVGLAEWNNTCTRMHDELFQQVRKDLAVLNDWVSERFKATLYEDPYSPFCLIAENNKDADQIHAFLDDYAKAVPELTVVRNDVYARFSHAAYNKGTALCELARRLNISREHIVVAGDHLNDLPMLSTRYAKWLISPSNAIPAVKSHMQKQNGYISQFSHGHGVADGLKFVLEQIA